MCSKDEEREREEKTGILLEKLRKILIYKIGTRVIKIYTHKII